MTFRTAQPDVRRPALWTRPTRASMAAFGVKVALLRSQRWVADLAIGPPRLARTSDIAFVEEVGGSSTPLWGDPAAGERQMQIGKVTNLRIAASRLDGLLLPAATVFSFWRHVGAPTTARGFVAGRMLQQGCMVPAIGGGLCQLSNALYETALQSGCRIVERHAHSRIVPGSAAEAGRDATVAWNYVDLRFAALQDLRLSVDLSDDQLSVRLLGRPGEKRSRNNDMAAERTQPVTWRPEARSCASCTRTDCHLHEGGDPPIE